MKKLRWEKTRERERPFYSGLHSVFFALNEYAGSMAIVPGKNTQ